MKYRGILLDLDGTVYNYDYCHDIAMEAVEKLAFEELKICDFLQNFNKAKLKLKLKLNGTAASHNRLLYFQLLCENLNLKPISIAYKLYECYWNVFISNMCLHEGVTDFLLHCQNYGIVICILTDLSAEIQYRKLIKLGIASYVDYIVSSEEVIYDKPNPIMFLTALGKMKMHVNEVCMIGDSLDKDIQGALSLGINVIHWVEKSVFIMDNPKYQQVNDFKLIKNLL